MKKKNYLKIALLLFFSFYTNVSLAKSNKMNDLDIEKHIFVAPNLVSSNPVDNASNATLSQDIVLTFDVNIVKGTGNILLKKSSDNSTVETYDISSSSLISISGTDLTINPTSNLEKATEYYLEIASTAIEDTTGDTFVGITDSTTFNFSTVDVVINEIVTDPQQDWSTTDFMSAPGGSSGSNDEWVELYIKSVGINFTGWTIELNDSSPVTGDLSSSGAFDVSNYITSGAGTFLSSEIGDFLVLGNVDGSGAINNSITINLKDPGGAIVDTVTLSGGGAPSGNASGIENEAVLRIPNGADTDVDSSDFSKGFSSIGSANSTTVTWDGSTDNNWDTDSNWSSNTKPTSTENIVIPSGLTNYPTASSAITFNQMLIESGATFIAQSSVIGNITYKRNLSTANWYFVSSPVSGEVMTDVRMNNSFADGSGGNRIGFAPYDNSKLTAATRWVYFTTSSTDALVNGKGYSTKLSTSGNISFAGNINTSNVSIALTQGSGGGGNDFNLIGNPFTAFIDNGTFLTSNTNELASETIWLWNQATSSYDTKVSGIPYKIAPGQGFFVKAASENNIVFNKTFQSHENSDTFQRATNLTFKLNLSDGANNSSTEVYYINGTTTSFDNGYDGQMFTGISYPLAIYTHLISNSQGKGYAIQSLPDTDFENMIIPIGINASSGKKITFSASDINLISGINLYIEDKQANVFTHLDNNNSEYTITLKNDLNGIGRFYIHTTSQVLSTKEVSLNNISVYKTSGNNLKLTGAQSGKVSLIIINILGKEVMKTSFKAKGVNNIKLPSLHTGVYIIKIKTSTGSVNKKIVIE